MVIKVAAKGNKKRKISKNRAKSFPLPENEVFTKEHSSWLKKTSTRFSFRKKEKVANLFFLAQGWGGGVCWGVGGKRRKRSETQNTKETKNDQRIPNYNNR